MRGVLLAMLALFGSGCLSNSLGYRDQRWDPDERLGELMRTYRRVQRGKLDPNAGHTLVDPERVRNDIERLTLEFPNHDPTLMANAVLSYEAREFPKAVNYLDRLFGVRSSHPEAAILRSRLALEEGNLPGARRLLERQMQYTPDHSGLREAYSSVLYMSREFDAADAVLDVAERLGAPMWRVAFNRGLIAEAMENYEQAELYYGSAANSNPDYEPAWRRLFGMRAERGGS